jgi:hypothetical protein
MTPGVDVRSLVAEELAKMFSGILPAQQTQPVVTVTPSLVVTTETLVELYTSNLLPAEMLRNEARTVRADLARVGRFEEWLQKSAQRISTPLRNPFESIAQNKHILFDYARFVRSQPEGNSTATVLQAMNAIMKLARWAKETGRLSSLPKYPTRGDCNEMRIQDQESEFQGEPVTLGELRQMMNPEVLNGCTWPEFANVTPAAFWRGVLLAHYCLGFRSQDWFAVRTTDKAGLLWSDIVTETQCPRLEDLHSEHGWAWYLVHKTKKKSRRAAKPVKLLVPLSRELREFIELFRGLDAERVFPLPSNSRYWSQQIQGILFRAGLDPESRTSAHKPVIQLSLGQKSVASFRKGCAAMWSDHVSESAASYLLQHSVTDGKVSAITREHYLKIYRPLLDIVPAMETLPIWSVAD